MASTLEDLKEAQREAEEAAARGEVTGDREITYRDALREAIVEEMERDEKVFLIGEDIGAYGGSYVVTRGFQEQYGRKRVIDAPNAELGIVGAAVGAAMGGLRPVVELMTINFSLLAIDQIVNHAAKIHYMFGGQFSSPVVIRTASGWGQLGATHSQTFEGWFAHVPGLRVVMPSTPKDAKGFLKSAIRGSDPVLFIEHSLIYRNRGIVPQGDYTLPLEGAEVRREGADVTIASWSRGAILANGAAEELAEQGINCEVIDMRVLRPLDIATVAESVRKTNRLVIVEESWRTMGLGAEIAAAVQEEAFDHLDAPIGRVGSIEVPMPYARNLERLIIPGKDEVIAAVKQTLA
ncbi:MAG TPA: alpha-ketoacid dehydrogenase subunit beta [Thermomicrobiales bacterium]|nr:alpha-ketoacid dehydrogenase subunit beta [Thermomicrobiales bacterium]